MADNVTKGIRDTLNSEFIGEDHCVSLISKGKLDLAEILLRKNLQYLLDRKNATLGLKYLDKYFTKTKYDFYFKTLVRIQFYIFQNNCEELDKIIPTIMGAEQVLIKKMQREGLCLKKVYETIIYRLNEGHSDNNGSLILREFCVRYYLLMLQEWQEIAKESEQKYKFLEKTLTLLLEGIILAPTCLAMYLLASKLYLILGDFEKAQQLLAFLRESSDAGEEFRPNQRIAEELAELEKTILSKENDESSAYLVQDGKNLSASKINGGSDGDKGPSENDEAATSISSIDALVLREKSGEENSELTDTDKTFRYWERNLICLFSHQELEEFRAQYKDLAVALFSLGFYRAMWVILERVEALVSPEPSRPSDPSLEMKSSEILERLESTSTLIEIKYFKIVALMQEKNFYEALMLIEETLFTYPLNEGEHLCFLYLQADVLWEIGERKRAYILFQAVKKVNPAYRLVQQRVRAFERSCRKKE